MTTEDRISRLEQESRVWRWATGLLGGVLCASVACTGGNGGGAVAPSAAVAQSSASRSVVRAAAFMLENNNGDEIGAFAADVSGAAFLRLGTSNQKGAQIVIGTGAKGEPWVRLFSATSKASAALGILGDDRGGCVMVNDQSGKAGVIIQTGEGGGGMINVFNPLGKNVATVQSAKNNGGLVNVSNFNGEVQKGLMAE